MDCRTGDDAREEDEEVEVEGEDVEDEAEERRLSTWGFVVEVRTWGFAVALRPVCLLLLCSLVCCCFTLFVFVLQLQK